MSRWKSTVSLLMGCLLGLGLFLSQAQAYNLVAPMNAKKLVEGQTRFALELYKQLAKKSGNLIFSPYSVSTALTMTLAGAKGHTAKEMAKVLGVHPDDASAHILAGKEMRELLLRTKQSKVKLGIANRLWGQKGFPFEETFLKSLKGNYGAGLETLDFKKNRAEARRIINHWVEKQTHDRIKNLIPKNVLKKSTRLILTNAVYFKARWQTEFKKRLTHKGTFWLTKSKKKSVKLMNQTRYFHYKSVNDLRVLKVPYKGGRFSMVILLPKEKEGWKKVQQLLTSDALRKWTTGMKMKRVSLALPRFEFTAKAKLKGALKAMGMKQAFTNNANFDGMVQKKYQKTHRLKIDKVLHKAFIAVKEGGTEAAAATAVIMVRATSAIVFKQPVPFVVNRPFLFAIQDNKTGGILFMGRVLNP